jgi:ATP-dependent protease ClpP protease subunit
MVNLLKICTDLNGSTIKRKLLPASDVWLKAEELIELGIADHIL